MCNNMRQGCCNLRWWAYIKHRLANYNNLFIRVCLCNLAGFWINIQCRARESKMKN